jgi:hypothetical protein
MGRDGCRGEDNVAHEKKCWFRTSPNSYGTPLAGWKGQTEFSEIPALLRSPGALPPDLASTFIEEIYVLVTLQRAVRVYRGFEIAGLQAHSVWTTPALSKAW